MIIKLNIFMNEIVQCEQTRIFNAPDRKKQKQTTNTNKFKNKSESYI